MAGKWIFRLAGLYGLLVAVPLFFLEATVSAPPAAAIARPEFYYGFAGVTTAFQILFLVISTDPVRYRPLMLVGVLEKLSVLPFIFLYFSGRAELSTALAGAVDQLLA